MVFGMHSVLEALRSEKDVEKVFLQTNLKTDHIQEIFQLAKEQGVPVVKVPVEKLNRFTRKNHQGVVCFVSAVNYAPISNVVQDVYEQGKVPMILILDQVTDVRNFGAIARTAECAGANAILIPAKGSASINSDAMKTSSGALNFIPVCREDYLKDAIQYLKDSGIQVVACTEKADQTLYEQDFTGPVAILMGNEEKGISPAYLELCDAKVKVPMTGQVSSLNVSVATGIIVFEAVRQRLG